MIGDWFDLTYRTWTILKTYFSDLSWNLWIVDQQSLACLKFSSSLYLSSVSHGASIVFLCCTNFIIGDTATHSTTSPAQQRMHETTRRTQRTSRLLDAAMTFIWAFFSTRSWAVHVLLFAFLHLQIIAPVAKQKQQWSWYCLCYSETDVCHLPPFFCPMHLGSSQYPTRVSRFGWECCGPFAANLLSVPILTRLLLLLPCFQICI